MTLWMFLLPSVIALSATSAAVIAHAQYEGATDAIPRILGFGIAMLGAVAMLWLAMSVFWDIGQVA